MTFCLQMSRVRERLRNGPSERHLWQALYIADIADIADIAPVMTATFGSFADGRWRSLPSLGLGTEDRA